MKTALDAARAYLDKLPPAISGAGGHAATFTAACSTVRLGLSDGDALALLREYNGRCQPPWTEKELTHKLRDARRVAAGQGRTYQQTKPAVRHVWKVERKATRIAEPKTVQAATVAPAPAQAERPKLATPEPTANLTPCPGWQAVPPENLPLNPNMPRPAPHRERVIAYMIRQGCDRPGRLTAWLVHRECDYYDGPGRRWDCAMHAYAAARDAACWQLNRDERAVWALLDTIAEMPTDRKPR